MVRGATRSYRAAVLALRHPDEGADLGLGPESYMKITMSWVEGLFAPGELYSPAIGIPDLYAGHRGASSTTGVAEFVPRQGAKP